MARRAGRSARPRRTPGAGSPRAEGAGGSPPDDRHITEHEIEDIEERSQPRAPVIYEVVRKMGEEEMARPAASLWWSGVAAGLSMSFSLLAQAVLQLHLPDEPWRPLVTSLGYAVGFLMVVLSRQQLFTENTITAVLPVMAAFNLRNLALLGRMWGIVLAANLVGTLLAALLCAYAPVISPALRGEMMAISREVLEHGWFEMFCLGIGAGYLVAAMVWAIPSSEGAQFHVITVIAYLIGVAGFIHIVAGGVEAFLLVVQGELAPVAMIADFMIPVLLGNVVGGTALFAVISYAQVMEEI
jgi:formate/nitrite transporter FocA (FNT family)